VSTPPDSSKPTWTVGFPALVREMEPPSRESAYLSKAEKNLHASRESRLVHLRNAVTRNAIDRATERLSDMAHPDLDYVVIRTPFIYGLHLLPNPPTPYMDGGADFATFPPPLTRVLRRKNQHAIALYLTLLFVQQVHVFRAGNPAAAGPRRRKAVFNLDGSFSEASLIGLPSFDRRNQRRVFNRALDALEKAELVDLGRSGQRYATYTLNCEDGSGHA
jgi:hypothetical protein